VMFRAAQPERDDETVEMTAMVDVVFILLSFFVLASQFRLHELDFPMGYRRVALAAGAAAEDFPKAVPVILRPAPGGVAITVGRAVLATDGFDQLRAKLTEINMPEIPVTLLADASLSVDQVARALDAVLASPMKKVSVAAPSTTKATTRAQN
jgi:biopolymer transport protein ExbD